VKWSHPPSSGAWKSGWREVGGKKIYFRSRWEANYARYLQSLKDLGEISSWDHEAETFWFEKILRGCRSYLPDFRVALSDGSVEYHEVKGWMDSRSRTVLNRMRIYHPKIIIKIIDESWFRENREKTSACIPDWEPGNRGRV